jgi:hypothetical protein
MLEPQSRQISVKRNDLDPVSCQKPVSHPLTSKVFVGADEHLFRLGAPLGDHFVGSTTLTYLWSGIIRKRSKDTRDRIVERIKSICHPVAQASVEAELPRVSRRGRGSPSRLKRCPRLARTILQLPREYPHEDSLKSCGR